MRFQRETLRLRGSGTIRGHAELPAERVEASIEKTDKGTITHLAKIKIIDSSDAGGWTPGGDDGGGASEALGGRSWLSERGYRHRETALAWRLSGWGLGRCENSEGAFEKIRNGATGAGISERRNPKGGKSRLYGYMQAAIHSTMIHLTRPVNFISELEDIDTLVRLYEPRLLRYIAFSLGDRDLAETITQDCFLKAYAGRASFRGDCSVSTWLFTIANNLIRDQLRTKKFQFWRKASARSVDISELASFLPSNASSPETTLLVRERTRQVRQALDDLSVNQRRVFLLKFSEEMDLEEISQLLGMPVNTVKTHLRRAITAIRARLGGQLPGGAQSGGKR